MDRHAPTSSPVLAFDVGATNLRSAWVSADGDVAERQSVPTPRADPDALVDTIRAEARRRLDEAGRETAALGLAIAGFTDRRGGKLHRSPCMFVERVDLVAPLHEALGVPIRLVNDVSSAAWAESRTLGCDELVAIFVGTGIGTGFVCNGALVEGFHGMAGEGGQVVYRHGTSSPNLSPPGSFSAFMGGDAMAARARERGLEVDTAGLIAAARDGRAVARAVLDDAIEGMERMVHTLTALFDPERFVLGGSVVEHCPELFDAAARAADPHPLTADLAPIPVEAARLGGDAGLIGAGLLALAEGAACSAAS